MALNEQSTASNDIAKNIETIAQMSETNNISVREITENMHDLKQLTDVLEKVSGSFII